MEKQLLYLLDYDLSISTSEVHTRASPAACSFASISSGSSADPALPHLPATSPARRLCAVHGPVLLPAPGAAVARTVAGPLLLADDAVRAAARPARARPARRRPRGRIRRAGARPVGLDVVA